MYNFNKMQKYCRLTFSKCPPTRATEKMWGIDRFAKCQPCLDKFSSEIKAQYFLTRNFHRSAYKKDFQPQN